MGIGTWMEMGRKCSLAKLVEKGSIRYEDMKKSKPVLEEVCGGCGDWSCKTYKKLFDPKK